jgi:predicted enzyme related to lactoylglutathione lyase
MNQPVVHFEIEVLDAARARAFYSELFGWTINVIPGNSAEYGLIEPPAVAHAIGGALCGVPDVPSSTWRGKRRDEGHAGQVSVFVQVPDVEQALQRAAALGGRRMLGPDAVGLDMHIGRFLDPEGQLIGVVAVRGQTSLEPA